MCLEGTLHAAGEGAGSAGGRITPGREAGSGRGIILCLFPEGPVKFLKPG